MGEDEIFHLEKGSTPAKSALLFRWLMDMQPIKFGLAPYEGNIYVVCESEAERVIFSIEETKFVADTMERAINSEKKVGEDHMEDLLVVLRHCAARAEKGDLTEGQSIALEYSGTSGTRQ